MVQTTRQSASNLEDHGMTDEPNTFELPEDDPEEYSAEELLEQAQINAQALFLGTAEALSSDEHLLLSWASNLANTFIKGWDTEQEWDAADILYALVTNYQAYGAEVSDSDFNGETPYVKLANLPNLHLAEALEIAPDRLHHLFRIGEALAARLGGKLDWTAKADGTVRLEVRTP
jgi:hypothetical protein